MNDEPTGKTLPNEQPATDWERLRHMSDADIRAAVSGDPDIIPTDKDFWRNATVVLPQRKPTITIRLDADVLAWLKDQGKGYQTRINAILRSYMKAQNDRASSVTTREPSE
ncbi:MAG: BrnA antitoxin family protein [Aphanocapsa sp. GSE-SYN-MK-11-07L]|jgi:uncharacterized protein (DUF4415 family)|nr:BrnA antitoxin family protein [Aphanocapsa sp. GSE-SYN-MK-11-07L]